MATIDSLDIKIEGSAQKANDAIDSLIINLGRLAESLKIDTSKLSNIGKALNLGELGKSAKTVENQMQKISKSASEAAKEFQNKFKDIDVKVDFSKPEAELRKFQKQAQTAKNSLSRIMASSSADSRIKEIEKWSISLAQATNAVDILEKHIAETQTTKLDIDTNGIKEAEQTIKSFTEQLRYFSDVVDSGGWETGAGIEMPVRGLELSLETLRNMYPEAKDLISSYEAEIERAKRLSSNAATETYKDIDLSAFENISLKAEELKARTEQFEQSLKKLQIPPVNTDNLNVLQRELANIEKKYADLRVELANKITMGKISANVDDKGFRELREKMYLAEKTAEALRGKIKQVQQASTQTSTGAKKLGDSIKSASKSIGGLATSSAKAIKPLNNLGNSFRSLLRAILPILGVRQLFNWGKQSMEVASDLVEVQNVVDTTFGDMSYKVENFAKLSIKQFGMSELALKEYASRFQAMGVAMGISSRSIGNANSFLEKQTSGYIKASNSMADMSLNLTKLTADMSSFYNVEQEVVAKSLQSVFTGETEPLRRYGLDLTQATLAEWAMKQGLDADIKSMSQAEKTMLRYQYVMANTVVAQGDFARTADTWANQVRILKQSFEQLGGVVGTSLINAFKPLVQTLNNVMQYVIAFAEKVTEALGAIFGWKYESGGTGGISQDWSDIADSTGEAAGNIDKMKKGLRAFDELNNLTSSDKSGDGAGDISGIGDGAGGGLVKTDTIWENYKSDIDTLGKLGKYIGDTLSKTMESIDWDSIYQKARDFGKGLAEFLNGLISPTLFENIGKTVAGALNTALHFLDSFGLWFDWKNFGDSLAAGLLGFLNNIQWDVALSAASNWGTGIADALNHFITPETFGATGHAIAMALNTAIQFALSFGQTFDFKNLGESIAAGINEFFATFNFKDLAKTLNIWAKGILDAAITALSKTDWSMIGKQIGKFIAKIDLLTIGKKMGKALWKAINAGIKLFTGSFSKAPIETTIISLMGIPKALKAITDTKFVRGIQELVSNFKKFGEAAKLSFLAFSGNAKALETLTTNFPKLGKAVDVLQDSFQRLMFGVHFGDYAGGINAAIDNIRNNLTGLQKGAITAAAGFIEFNVVSETFEGMTLGTENLVSGIAKIGVTVAAAGAAMYVALGPAGLAIAAITGVSAAIMGINDAFDTIRAQEIGESIKNAMSNPGGVPLSEITSGFASAFSEAASGFDLIKEKSSEMDSVQKNIENTWIEIYKIQEAMDNGVVSVEEGKTQLETLFSELATLTEQKFSTMNSAVMSAYGEGGSFKAALDSLGADTEAAIDTMITYGYQNSERAKEIAQELAGMDIHSEDYTRLITELASLTGEMSNFEKATSDFTYDMNSLQGKIDYSEIFLEDGSVNTEALKKYLDEAAGALDEYEVSLDEAGKEINRYWQEIYNSPTATEDQKAIAEANLNYIPEAIENMKTEAGLKVVEFTDMLQNDFITKTGSIIEDAQNTWNSKTDWDKFWNGVFGAGTEGEYVKEAVEQQQKNVDELSAAIEESFGNLEIDGVVWASDAAKEIYGALFDSEYIHSEVGLGHYKYTLNEDYKEIIEGATEGIADIAAERGKDASDGYANGITNNVDTGTEAAKSFAEKVIEKIAEVQDSHSPSKVTEGLGKDAVDGYTLGIESNKNSTINTIALYTTEVIDKFSDIIEPLRQIGIDAMNGLYNGLSSMENSLYAKARQIANNIAKTIKSALDIHSPSKVMFELGNYTMQGFKNGLENLYYPIVESARGFGNDLEMASEPNINDMYGNYQQTAEFYTPNPNAGVQQNIGYDKNSIETNSLLRKQNELLDAILKKPILGNDDVFNAVKSAYTIEAKRRFGNSSKFDPVLG